MRPNPEGGHSDAFIETALTGHQIASAIAYDALRPINAILCVFLNTDTPTTTLKNSATNNIITSQYIKIGA
jgi:hypothetical protein